MSLNDDDKIDEGSYYHMLDHSMNFFVDWEENFYNAVDDTFMMNYENGVDISADTESFYFGKAREDMSAVLLKDFSEYIFANGDKAFGVMPFMFYDLKIDARNFAQRQKMRNEYDLTGNGDEIITDLRELNPRLTQEPTILRVLRPQ